jgi:hypothetical protein
MRLFAPRLAHGARLDLEGLALRLKVNPRARRVSLRVDARTGEAVATAPSARRLGEAVAFAGTRRAWLGERMAARAGAPAPGAGAEIEVFGIPCVLVPDGRRPRLAAGKITGCGLGAVDPQLAIRAIRREALAVFTAGVAAHCRRLGVTAPMVATTDARSRWGSCTPATGRRAASIRLSWRLALAPFAVADYVVAHECAHLIEANHGPRFWALVGSLIGDPSPHRAFLRREGARLHGFGR